ncbi:MAG: long-chain-fatty-acid--CoA ligase [Chloroflexi bacterium]|nr:MAG: long-chain-fatty-acid--CoA ligase [Chloroflexota bacterium]
MTYEFSYPLHAGDLLSKRAELSPDHAALLDLSSSRVYTFKDLNKRANCLANLLSKQFGVNKGDRVSILAQNSVVYLDLLYGLAKIGAVFAPLNWRLTSRELIYIINDCEPKVLICGPEFVDVVNEMRPYLHVQDYLSIEDAQIDGALVYEKAVGEAPSEEPERPELTGEDPYCILYTSGTTGRPKGAVLPHRQILFNCINTVISWGLNANDVSPVFTPLFHAGGLFAFLTPIHYAGGKIILARSFDADVSLELIQKEKCTVILGVPTLFQIWMNSPAFPSADFNHVRFFISGGAPCPVSLIEAWHGAKGGVLRQGYGLTEVGVNCFSMNDEDSLKKAGSVGKPIFHSKMRVVDDHGDDQPAGETGELIIYGPHVCSGYWRNPEATGKALKDGWFHTGDMARKDEDGYFYLAGRYKDMIISGGENIYAAEVETVFLEHPAVGEAALIGQPDPKWGEVGLMVVVLKTGKTATQEELQSFCQKKLARYKIPKRVIFTDSLPYSPYGKVMKAELRERFIERS